MAVFECVEPIRGIGERGRVEGPSRCGVGLTYRAASFPQEESTTAQ
jgi:hypothetical protein